MVTRVRLVGASLLFLVSGALGLGYEVLWSRQLEPLLGATARTQACTLGCFMAGLALGAALLGGVADRARSPLRVYALLELGVAIWAILFPSLLTALNGVVARFAGGEPAGLLLPILAGAILLVPPSFLLGGTLPPLVRFASGSLAEAGPAVARLYGLNAGGAVFGALGVAFVLLPRLGLSGSLALLAVGNLLVAVLALLIGARVERPWTGTVKDDTTSSGPAWPRAPILLLVFAEGAAAFVDEIAWSRYFAGIFGSSTYSFALVVAVFVAGVSTGAALLSRRRSWLDRPLATLAWSQLLIATLVLSSLQIGELLPVAVIQVGSLVSPSPGGFYLLQLFKMFLAACVMFLPAVGFGMALPLAVRAVTRDLSRLGRETGRVSAANTAGNVVGALVAGFVLLEHLGVERTLLLAGVLNVLVGIAAIFIASRRRGEIRRGWIPVAVAMLLLAVEARRSPWDPAWFTLEPFRGNQPGISRQGLRATVESRQILFHRDDPAASVTVVARRDRPQERSLLVNGKPDASTGHDMATQRLVGFLPLALHEAPRQVLVIGLGSGVTASAVLADPQVARVDVVEIVAAMEPASRFFDHVSGAPLDDPRTDLRIDDARRVLATTNSKYDLVVSQPSNPWAVGNGSLFSQEFYREVRQVLAPGGVLVQWLQTYEISDGTLAVIVGTLSSEFPFVIGFQGGTRDLVLLASVSPLVPSVERLQGIFQNPRFRREMADIGVEGADGLLALQWFGPRSMKLLAEQAPLLNSDDNLHLEHRAPLDLHERQRPTLLEFLDEREFQSPALLGRVPEDPLEVMRVLQAPLLARPELARRWERALIDLGVEIPSLSDEVWLVGPLTPEQVEEDLRRILRDGRLSLAAAKVEQWLAGAVIEARLDRARGELWWQVLSDLRHEFPARPLALEMVAADVALVTGRGGEARRILNGLGSRLPVAGQWRVAVRQRVLDGEVQVRPAILGTHPAAAGKSKEIGE